MQKIEQKTEEILLVNLIISMYAFFHRTTSNKIHMTQFVEINVFKMIASEIPLV